MDTPSMNPVESMMFSSLPDDAHVWLHAAEKELDSAQAKRLMAEIGLFRTSWRSHGQVVQSDSELIDHRLLILAADVPGGSLSGCGIDKSLHALDHLCADLGFSWAGGLDIVYRDGNGNLQTVKRPVFRQLVLCGAVDEHTPVVDLAVQRLADIRQHGIEVTLASSWHARFLERTPVTDRR